jgi:hypothetical protein
LSNACQTEKLVEFSCKRRGFWPSCGARPSAGASAYGPAADTTGISRSHARIHRPNDACRAILAGDDDALREAVLAIGYAHPDDPEVMTRNSVDIIRLACEPLAERGPYDFAASGLAVRTRDLVLAVAFGKDLRSPPPETLFLHRKLIEKFV